MLLSKYLFMFCFMFYLTMSNTVSTNNNTDGSKKAKTIFVSVLVIQITILCVADVLSVEHLYLVSSSSCDLYIIYYAFIKWQVPSVPTEVKGILKWMPDLMRAFRKKTPIQARMSCHANNYQRCLFYYMYTYLCMFVVCWTVLAFFSHSHFIREIPL